MESAHKIYFEKEDILKYISCLYEVNVTNEKRFISSNIQSASGISKSVALPKPRVPG